jgi:aryl-alcohol dehydrogenase-like predicted oxidoreductase
MKRRSLIGGLAGATLAWPLAKISQAQSPKIKSGDVPMRTFGKTGVKLSVVGLASGRFHLTTSDDDAVALTRHAVELGINYFDTAASYWNGHSEEIYGIALKPYRKQVFITTKSTERSRAGAERELNQSLKRLQTDYLDLWQVHAVGTKEEIDQVFAPGGAIEAFEAAKRAGKCRFLGFTGHADPYVHLEMLKRYDKWDTILMPLHIADPLYLSFEKLVLPLAVEKGLGIQGMKNFANAKLLQQFSVRECLSYVLSLPAHCTAIGCTTKGQLEDDVRIAQNFKPFDAAQMAALQKRAERIKGPLLEDWKKNIETKVSLMDRPQYTGG